MNEKEKKNNLDFIYTFANSEKELLSHVKTLQEKLLAEMAYNYFKKMKKNKAWAGEGMAECLPATAQALKEQI